MSGLLPSLDAVRAEQARRSLADFIRYGWQVVEPGTPLAWNWHIDAIALHCQATLEGWRAKQLDASFIQPIQNLLINVPPGTAKPCFNRGMIIEKTRGLIELGDVRVGDHVVTHRGRYRRVVAVHQQGLLPLYEIRTRRGRVVKVAADHPLLTARGWVAAQHLATSDVLAEVHPAEPSGSPTISQAESRLLGYIVGDGCVSQTQAATFTNQDEECVRDFIACAESLNFSTRVKKRPGKSATTNIVALLDAAERKGRPRVACGPVRAWVRRHDLEKKTSYTKRVPRSVFEGDDEIVCEFLAAYWACDGSISDRRDVPRSGRSNQTVQSVRINAVTVSEGLARDLQALLNRLGLSFTVRRKESNFVSARQGQTYVSWSVSAESQDVAAKFLSLIQSRMRHRKKSLAPQLKRTDFDVVLNPDRITSIEQVGQGECSCLTVEEDASFSYEGVAVHNSRIISVFMPAWMWTRWPSWKVIYLSANPRVALRDSMLCRELIESEWYRAWFKPGWVLAPDQNAKGLYHNSAGGYRQALGFTSKLTGARADCLAGWTKVATERGEIPIAELVGMTRLPRVWSFNHETGELELKKVVATSRIPQRQTVSIRTRSGHMLECTHDHRIFADGSYTKAENVAGLRVSVMRRANVVALEAGDSLFGVRSGDAGLPLREVVYQSWGGSGQEPQRTPSTHVMFGGLRLPPADGIRTGNQQTSSDARADALRNLWEDFPHFGQAWADDLFSRVSGETPPLAPPLSRPPVRAVRRADGSTFHPAGLLWPDLCESSAQPTHDGARELTFQGELFTRRVVLPMTAIDPRAGRLPVRDVRNLEAAAARSSGSPYRSQSSEQYTGKPHHALRFLSLQAPQVAQDTVSTVAHSGTPAHAVYDIQVEDNHNFFANGILVHNCLVVDDPHDAQEVNSEALRHNVTERWDAAISNRVNDLRSSIRIGIMQRLHDQDWSGHVLAQGGWEHLCIPMEFDPETARTTCLGWRDPRTERGELLFPERFPAEIVAAERKRLGAYGYAGQHQQRPALAEGGMLKRHWWRYWIPAGAKLPLVVVRLSANSLCECPQVELPGVFEQLIQSWDMAFKDTKDSAYVVGQVWGKQKADRFLLDQKRDKMNFPVTVQAVRDLTTKWPPAYTKLVEDKANGPAVMQTLQHEIAGLTPVEPEGGKEARVNAVSPQIESGNVYLPHPALYDWVDGFVGECAAFPNGAYADQVDAMSQALLRLQAGGAWRLTPFRV